MIFLYFLFLFTFVNIAFSQDKKDSAVLSKGSNYQTHSGFIQPRFVKRHHVEFKVSLYPNPTTDYVNIYISEQGDYKFRLIDMSGNVIKTEYFSAKKNQS